VDSNKKRKLETTIAALQDRWGNKAIGRLKADPSGGIAHVSTGFPALDEALAIGGLPRGRISELNGIPSSGMATIALKLVANAQAQKSMAIYIDLDQSFDPDYATRCGLVLEQLVLVRPHGIPQALAILQDIILGAEADILVFDTPLSLLSETQSAQALATTLGRLIAPLGRAQGVLLFLISLPANSTPDPTGKPVNSTLAHFATVRLFIQRERWTYQQQDINGYQAQVLVTKNKLGPAGKQASIRVVFYDAGGSENGDSEDGSLEDDATAGDVR
jgi:recombination protein RecA